MIRYFVFAALLASGSLQAQYKHDGRFRITPSVHFCFPLGGFSINGNEFSDVAPAENFNLGGGVIASLPVSGNFYLGLNTKFVTYELNKAKVNAVYMNRYADPAYYTYTSGARVLEIGTLAPVLSYRINARYLEVEPYISVGFSYVQNRSDILIQRKKINDNYRETYKIKPEKNAFLFQKTVGASANIPLAKWAYVVVGGDYSFGSFTMEMKETHTDLYKTQTTRPYTVSQPVSAMQLHIGLQARMGSIPK